MVSIKITIVKINIPSLLILKLTFSEYYKKYNLIIRKQGYHLYELEQRFTEHNVICTINFPERRKDGNELYLQTFALSASR